MENDIYAAPEADLAATSTENNELASRWKRLWASMIDGIIISCITLPTMFLTGGLESSMNGVQTSAEYNLMIGALGLVFFLLINFKLLKNKGQTIGKKVLGIKMVDLDGGLPQMKKHLLKRYAAYFLPGQIPFAGPIVSLINILFIFGKQKRCVHDYIAGTKVVMV